jgi:hypothetical protein
MNFKSLDIIKRYLSGDLGLESVAEELHRGGDFTISSSRIKIQIPRARPDITLS